MESFIAKLLGYKDEGEAIKRANESKSQQNLEERGIKWEVEGSRYYYLDTTGTKIYQDSRAVGTETQGNRGSVA
jgi:hypothetical protein